MKTILTTLNSKFTHTSLALRLIGNWLNERGIEAKWLEYTINTPVYEIIGDLYREQPEILIFSVYIWNGTETRMIAKELKKLMPKCKIVFGGPEVSFDSIREMENNPEIDAIVSGEGEGVVEQLLRAWHKNVHEPDFKDILGLTWRKGNEVIMNGTQLPIDMDLLAFPYPDLETLSNRILYYESSRGCPFNCSYCLSSATKGVRFKSDGAFESHMLKFLEAKVMQVKFIDRTFNADPKRAMRLWQWLAAHDNDLTNFHFEITAELLREEDLIFLSQLRPGLFQFEIGIQTTMIEASEAVNRRLCFDRLKGPVSHLLKAGNLHVHLDLIAGLPYETYERFLQSFDDVYDLEPQVLQLGFLKLIKGSQIRKQTETHGYIYEDYQPYEVLQTNYIQFDQLLKLKDLEVCLECLHNSKRFNRTLKTVLSHYPRSSEFYVAFATWLREKGYFKEAIKTERWYELIWKFATTHIISDQQDQRLALDPNLLRLHLMMDYMSSLGKAPLEWMQEPFIAGVKEAVFEIAKDDIWVEMMPHLEEISPKERVKKIRFAGFDKKMTNLLIKSGSEDFVNGTYTIHGQFGILLVDLSHKHPVSEQYPIYIFV